MTKKRQKNLLQKVRNNSKRTFQNNLKNVVRDILDEILKIPNDWKRRKTRQQFRNV